MLIGFDASRAFVNEATGTENYSLNLLLALAKIDRKNRYVVYLRPGSRFTVHGSRKKKTVNSKLITDNRIWPANFEFKVIRPYRLWTQLGLALETWRNPVDLLFVPAHTLPILRRRSFMVNSSSAATSRKIPMNDKRLTRHDTKYVVTIHDLGVEFLPGYHQFPQRYYLDFASRYASRHADALIAVSAATKRDLIKTYAIDTKKIFVVPEGVDGRFFKPQSKLKVQSVKSKYKIKEPYILFVGTVQPRKNLEMLIKAFSLLVHSSQFTVNGKSTVNRQLLTDNCQFVLAGKLGWDYDEILSAPEKYGVKERVKFIGYVPRKDLPALYSGAAVCAFPSLFEGFDLPILEALSCGCLVVASDIGAHREIVSNLKFKIENLKFREAIVLVKPNDIDNWFRVLYHSISQYETRKSFISERRRLVSRFSWEEAAKQTLAVFEGLLS